jgi:2-polyprenylphenol 6-hydroxylase
MTVNGTARASIVIVGAGPVGLMLAALLLARSTLRINVTLIDAGTRPQWDPHELDLRVYALSRASQRMFEHLGLWHGKLRDHVSPYQHVRVWEGHDPMGIGSVTFDAAELGEPDLGSIAEDVLLRAALLERLAGERHFTLRLGARLGGLEVGERGALVRTQDGETLHAALVVGADGGASEVRSLLAMPVVTCTYGQAAVVAHVTSEKPHRETAWQRFLPEGPVALLPLRDGRSSIVWTADPEHAERLIAQPSAIFARELGDATGAVLGRFGEVSRRACFALKAQHAPRYSAARVALIGDAAHTVHPLAGQGMNLGLLDAAALADAIEEALVEQQDPGDLRTLKRYERRRKGENLKMLVALDALNRLFRLPRAVGIVRELGMGLVDRAAPLKRTLARRALGVAGPLPSAARQDRA